ncbi:abietadienol/abietadienal oxidase [Mercurialis annua]|uniref:abietadienol/abietadienal oxidase n=1 Tax=Mercurialis annua TaxID=3986 RepID=UPI00215EED49|nr:abietadienol/abietadienal oxidase [Mercurialis annua]
MIEAILITLVCIITWVYLRKKKKIKQPYKLPAGRRGWPVIGDSLRWYKSVSGSYPPQFAHQQASRYGKIFSCSLFGKWTVVSTDSTFNRFVMQNEGKLFKSNYPKSFTDLVGKNGVITVHGDQHRKLHGIASNLLRIDKLNGRFFERIQLVMLRIFDEFRDQQVVLLQDVCRKVAISLMVNQLVGVSSGSEISEMAQLFSHFVDGCLSVPIYFPGSSYYTAIKARKKIIRKIEERIKKCDSSGFEENGVLGRLVNEENLDNEAIKDFILNLLFAGNETTAKTMLLAVYFLTHSPKAMHQILEEHHNIRHTFVGDDEFLTWQHYKAMPFTQCVIDETLRIGGIAIWLMREAKEDVVYQEYVIPKGWPVIPFLSAVHLDENLYKGALSFNPWRWMDSEYQEKRNWRNSCMYAPFGGGPRFCPGADLARLQIALFLHCFLTKFRWTQLKEDRLSFFPSARLVNGFQIRLTTICAYNAS